MAKKTRTITGKDIVDGLKRLGLKSGDHVMVHCALSSLGHVVGGAEALIDALVAAVGPDGTIMVPAFDTRDEVFDPGKSETTLGAISQALWRRTDAVRSAHPAASVAAVGGKAGWLVENHVGAETAHGKGSPYHKLCEIGGKVLLLGVDQDRNTFLHTAEALARLPYLRPVRGTFIDSKGKKRTGTWRHFPGPHRNFIGLQKWMEDNGLTRKTTIGSCVAQLMPCRELLAALLERLKFQPGLLISDNPNLPDSIRQKADVLAARWRRCSFITAADSRFAGQYIEEIIDNLARFGIGHVILSYVNDTPWNRVEPARRKWYLQGLRRAKIKPSAIRLPALSSQEASSLLAEARADTLIVPSTCPPGSIVSLARGGFNVLLENTSASSGFLAEMVKSIPPGVSGNVRLAFDPLGFAQAGENPFLKSYHTPIRKHVGLLYINDGLASGRRVPLEQGLSEIKELVSILHCKGFEGIFALQSTQPADFARTVRKFIGMLEELGAWPEDF